MRVGIDFDNTLVCYDDVFLKTALANKLLPADFAGNKQDVRDTIRRASGDWAWTELQAEVYGRRMAEARMIEGAAGFVAACRNSGVPVHIVSHKTQFAAADPGGADLRAVALDWMEANGFFRKEGLDLSRSDVFFESTREEKCRRIAALACTHFIDDLEEVFNEPCFPKGVQSFLLYRGEGEKPQGPFTVMPAWSAITEAIFARV